MTQRLEAMREHCAEALAGERGSVDPVRWRISRALRGRMVEVARELRRQQTPGEAILWQALRGRRLAGRRFRRQQPIGPFVVDFFCASERLIVEVDGPIHEGQREADVERQQLLESLGLRFVRIRTEQVSQDLEGALETIRAALKGSPKA